MKLVGKRPPEADSLGAAADDGFDEIELYLTHESVAGDSIVETVERSPVDATVVHTPHVTIDELDVIDAATRIATDLEAYLVVHSQFLQAVHIPDIVSLEAFAGVSEDEDESRGETDVDFGFENNPGSSIRFLETMILNQGYELVLDTAHLYMAHEDYLERIDALLTDHGDAISVVHFTDSTATTDGVPFGEGEMEMAQLARVLDDGFDGKAVLEVMPDHQRAAREFVESALSERR